MGQPLPDSAAMAASITNPAEFALLFDRHFDVVHGYIRKRVGRSLADDLASQTFLIAFDRRAEYDQTRPNARPWLLGIATNLIHGKRRQEKRQLRAMGRAGVETDPDPLEGVEHRVDARRLRPQLAAPARDPPEGGGGPAASVRLGRTALRGDLGGIGTPYRHGQIATVPSPHSDSRTTSRRSDKWGRDGNRELGG